jgi:O-antigen/teichoic acid export membrane protein
MIARKSTLIIITHLLNGLLGYVGLKFIALYMEPWEYGVIGFAYGFVTLFSIFGNFGFNAAHIKRVSEGKDLGTCIATFAATKIALAGLLASVVIGSVAVWKYILGRGFETPFHETAVYIMLAYIVLLTVTHTMIYTYDAKKESVKSQLALFAYTVTKVIATIIVAYYGFGVLALAYTYLLGEIIHFAIALLFFKGYPIGRPSFECIRSYAKFAKPMAIASTSFVIMISIDKVFIQLFWSSTQVGEYFAIFNLSRFVILFVSAVGMLLFPTVSEYHAQNNMKKVKELVLKSERYLSMIIFPIVLIMVVLAEPLIHILISDKYTSALPVLHILPFFVLIEALSLPYVGKLQGMDMPEIVRNRYFIMMICNVSLNLVLIPREIKGIGIELAGLGGQGAAIATVVAYAVGLIYIRVIAWKLTGIKGNTRIFFHAVAAVVMSAILAHITRFAVISRWYELGGAALCGFVIYFALLYILKDFTKEDFNFFKDTVNVHEMIRYIKEELKIK